jgi:hypothetical protein
MKKIFTLLAAALVCMAVSAQECPTKTMMYLLDGEDASNVEIELGLSENNSLHLDAFYFKIAKPDGATWKKVSGNDYFTTQGYGTYIMACTTGYVDDDDNLVEITDELLEELCSYYCDVQSSVKDEKLTVIEVLFASFCRHYPDYPGKVGKFAIDMSALEDGEYELYSENTPENSGLDYFLEEQSTWQLDNPMVLTLSKQGNTVTEKSRTSATYVSSLSGISTITTDKSDNRIFDLQGRELQIAPEHGIYIQNGKKYVK